tara:strand:- start:1959 stop:2081 length:123 start_codon:yes stop_codon:yes gene_type:complete
MPPKSGGAQKLGNRAYARSPIPVSSSQKEISKFTSGAGSL